MYSTEDEYNTICVVAVKFKVN